MTKDENILKLNPMEIAFRSILMNMSIEKRCNELINIVEKQAEYTRHQAKELAEMRRELSAWNVERIVGEANEVHLARFKQGATDASLALEAVMSMDDDLRVRINAAIIADRRKRVEAKTKGIR